MRMFEIHEIEDRITEVLQQVQETGETVSVTEGCEVIAHLVPARTASWLAQKPDDAVWTNLERLSAEITALWPKDVSAIDAIRDVRREL